MSKMRPLINDEQTKARIAEIINHAENYPLTLSRSQKIMDGELPPPGDDPNHSCIVCYYGPGTGYRCVYTVDQATDRRPENFGETIWMRHLSISVDGGNCPNLHAVNFLMDEFGFEGKVIDSNGEPDKESKILVWVENENDDTIPTAINVMERYEKD